MNKELLKSFSEIYQRNLWQSKESPSGPGSELKNTDVLRKELPFVFAKYGIESILDIPCGDYNWMWSVEMQGIEYIGADIVPELIDANKVKHPDDDWRVLDITSDPLPKVDLIIVRDLIGHFTDFTILQALSNIQRSGSKYLLVTSFTKWNQNPDIGTDGNWKPINLMIKPYFLKPQYLINENCQEGYPHYNDKCMILIDLKNMYSK